MKILSKINRVRDRLTRKKSSIQGSRTGSGLHTRTRTRNPEFFGCYCITFFTFFKIWFKARGSDKNHKFYIYL